MPKAPRLKRNAVTPYNKDDDGRMDMAEGGDIPFKSSPLVAMDVGTSSKAPRSRKFALLPEDPSPHDGMTQQESEDALLKAMLPNLPKKGLSV
jgi:hypothetical protein